MTLNISLKNFYHTVCFALLYFSIFSHPISIIELIKNPVSISAIPYIVFTFQFLLFLKEYSINSTNFNLKRNYKLFLIITLFFFQLLGLLNAYLNNKLIFNYTKLESVYYLISASAYLLLLFNNRKNYNFLHKANIIQIIILLLVLLTFILYTKKITYGLSPIIIKIELFNFEKIYLANSNGLGRISLILALFFLIISISKRKLNYFIFTLATFFGGITLGYEGKFNTLMLIALVIYIIINSNYKNKIYLFIFFTFLSLSIYSINYNYEKKNLNKDELTKDQQTQALDQQTQALLYFNYNTNRIIKINNTNDELIIKLIRAHPNYDDFQYLIENKLIKEIDNYTTGRLNKFFFFFLYNQNFILGTGPMSDRTISNINGYKVNNDSASAITYTYLTSGILGLILLFYLYGNLIKIFINVKIKKVQLNKTYIKSLILLVFMRSLIENSFAVWGIDFCVLLLSIATFEYYGKEINKNSF
jgi:hypothetical protein